MPTKNDAVFFCRMQNKEKTYLRERAAKNGRSPRKQILWDANYYKKKEEHE